MKRIFLLSSLVILFSALFFMPVHAATQWSVCANGCDFVTIQSAVDEAGIGDTLALASEIFEENVVINKDLTIQGEIFQTVVDGKSTGSVITVIGPARVIFRNLVITNGSSSDGGGLKLVNSDVIVQHSVIHGNTASFAGGGIYNDGGALLVIDSGISDNMGSNIYNYLGTVNVVSTTVADASSGGIINFNGSVNVSYSIIQNNDGGGINNMVNDSGKPLTVRNSTLSGNQVTNYGGGLYSTGRGTVRIINSTLSENSAGHGGGGIFVAGPLLVANSTLYGNESPSGAAIWSNNLRSTRLDNTIIAQHPVGSACSFSPAAAPVVGGNNLVDDSTCGFLANPVTNISPNLGFWDGYAPVHELLAGSNAIDAGNNDICQGRLVMGIDQRDRPREVGACDIGAAEYQK